MFAIKIAKMTYCSICPSETTEIIATMQGDDKNESLNMQMKLTGKSIESVKYYLSNFISQERQKRT